MLVGECVVVLEPVNVLVYDFCEDLVEQSGHMRHFQVKELEHKNKFLAHSVYYQFVVGSEHFLKGVESLL
jgi:hypothetical protein